MSAKAKREQYGERELKVHVWCPGIDPRTGGIENYSFALVRALRGVAGIGNVSVFAKHETAAKMRALLPSDVGVAGAGQVPLAIRTAPFFSLLAARAAVGQPDLIISTHLNFAPLAMWLKRMLSVRYCVALHGIEAWTLRRPSQTTALRQANLLIPVSRFTRDTVAAAQQLPLSLFRILPNTIDAEQFTIGPKPGYLMTRHNLSRDVPVILTVGRLDSSEQYKGQDRIIRVLRDVRAAIPGVRYIIVGDGNDRGRLESLARAEGVAGAVIFAGHVGASELPDYYRLCDLFALPSTGEGFGIVFLEALACGRPVLGGVRDGAPDPLVNGELGVLVDPQDMPALGQAIRTILAGSHVHPLLYQAEALRAAVLEKFDFRRFEASLGEHLSAIAGTAVSS